MEIEISERALERIRSKGGVAAIDYIPPVAWGAFPEVSVDTYLKRKNLTRYERVHSGDVEILVAPVLVMQATRISLDTTRGWFGTSFEVDIEARGDHFHGPGCRH